MAVGLDLDQYVMKNRVLLVCAPEPEDARYEEQHEYLEEGDAALQEWKIVVFGMFQDGPSFAEDRPISHEDAVRARERFGVEEGEFGLHLLDLDGTRILESSEPLPVPDIVDVAAEKVG